jgi:hypothetical protein
MLTAGRGDRGLHAGRVLVEVVGGLGNQMFQYAAARALADRLGADVGLDLRRFDTYRLRAPALHRWRIDARPMSAQEGRRYPRWLLRAAGRLPPAVQRLLGCFREPTLAFDPAFEALRRPMHLAGYFQSERYFHAIRERLLREFVPAEPLDAPNAALAAQMRLGRSVSLHVRRGDYFSVPENQQIHGSCSPAYYQHAIATVEAAVGPATWFVFSDDLAWVQQNLPVPAHVVYVDGNLDRPEWDIHLMSQCRHHVCANSSFSWWGAWLNPHPDKLVVAPRAWFATPRLDARDLVPAGWTRVAN